MNKTTISAAFAFLAIIVAPANATNEPSAIPDTAKIPFAAMEKLNGLHGEWTATTAIINSEGAWIEQHKDVVKFKPGLGGVLLTEQHVKRLSGTGFTLKTDFSFDQYRDHYRLTAVGNGWGLMDIYEGEVADDALLVDNLRSGTTFRLDDGREMHFRLTIPLKGDKRVMEIEQSTTAGKRWSPFYRVTYERAGD